MDYYSHYREKDCVYQLNREHQQNVADLCEKCCGIPLLKKASYISGLFHDSGKYQLEWQEYFEKRCKQDARADSEKLDHSTLGGLVVESYEPGSVFADLVRTAIFMHHGVADCVSVMEKNSLAEKRKKKYSKESVLEIRGICETEAKKGRDSFDTNNHLSVLCKEAREDVTTLFQQLNDRFKREGKLHLYGPVSFYQGMCERMLLSLLGDADVTDTVIFEKGNSRNIGLSDENIQRIWKAASKHLEQKLQELSKDPQKKSPLNRIREEISEQCKQAGKGTAVRYRLAVPTGTGKTLSGLRFALTRVQERSMRHIFYVAPFRSILEQNTKEIIDAVGNETWVLEHHGDVVLEDVEETQRYEYLIENWDEVPIIATTAVQFFNTLLKEKKRNLRRFHALCNSVIILDEVQAFPTKVLALLNLSVNFLTEVCGSTVVLCTATQPLTEAIAKNKMMRTTLMTQPLSVYEPRFRRVVFDDCTAGGRNRWDIAETVDFIREKAVSEKQVLAIFNTKSAARQIYDQLKGTVTGELFHLSTAMCAAHRNETLRCIKEALKTGKPVICISTQVIEAGWDVSFQCVIRSLAGLDNLIQAAGRCNRNGRNKFGTVHLIYMKDSAEHAEFLSEIHKAQQAMLQVLTSYYANPELFEERFDSEKMIERYYTAYLRDQSDFCYPVKMDDLNTDMVDLLSENKFFKRDRKYGPYLRQAFQSAGKAFSLIEEWKGIDMVVLYGEASTLLEKLDQSSEIEERKRLMRKLQRYIVNVSENTLKRMGKSAVIQRADGVLVLDSRYYNGETGVTQEPSEMVFLSI